MLHSAIPEAHTSTRFWNFSQKGSSCMGSLRSCSFFVLLLVVMTLALGHPMAVKAQIGPDPPPTDATPEELFAFLSTAIDDLVASGELTSRRGAALADKLD